MKSEVSLKLIVCVKDVELVSRELFIICEVFCGTVGILVRPRRH